LPWHNAQYMRVMLGKEREAAGTQSPSKCPACPARETHVPSSAAKAPCIVWLMMLPGGLSAPPHRMMSTTIRSTRLFVGGRHSLHNDGALAGACCSGRRNTCRQSVVYVTPSKQRFPSPPLPTTEEIGGLAKEDAPSVSATAASMLQVGSESKALTAPR